MTQVPSTTQAVNASSAFSAAKIPTAAEKLLPWLPCTLELRVPVVEFTVGSLLKLRPGSLLQTSCHQSSDLPLHVNGMLMAWTEFEVVGERLAARITDLV